MATSTNGMRRGTSRAEFEAVFPTLVEDLVHHCKQYNMPDNALQWFENVHRVM